MRDAATIDSAVGFLLSVSRGRSAAVGQANVLLVVIDDLNDWVGCLNTHPQVKTPNIDRLAALGVTFSNTHCQAPLCNPSRTSFLTGLRPTTTGIYALQPWFRSIKKFEQHPTFPQKMAQAGYFTFSTGKIHHDAYPPPILRVDRKDYASASKKAERKNKALGISSEPEFTKWGFGGGDQNRPSKKFVDTPDKNPLVDWGVFPERDELQSDFKIASSAIEFLKSRFESPASSGSPTDKLAPASESASDKPSQSRAIASDQHWLACVGFRRPHVPCYASQQWFDQYPLDRLTMPASLANERDRVDVPAFAWNLHYSLPEPRLAWLKRAHQHERLVQAYLASISFVDAQVGRVINALDELEQTRKPSRPTIVMVISDHGWHLGEKGITGKNSLWERSTRVPMIWSLSKASRNVASPIKIAAGKKCQQPTELLDLYPTLVDLLHLPKPELALEGESLAGLLADPEHGVDKQPAITSHGPGNHSVRDATHRLIRYADGSLELYDVVRDPDELNNLAFGSLADQPAEIRQVIERLSTHLPKAPAAPAPGSVSRLITFDGKDVFWETKKLDRPSTDGMADQ